MYACFFARANASVCVCAVLTPLYLLPAASTSSEGQIIVCHPEDHTFWGHSEFGCRLKTRESSSVGACPTEHSAGGGESHAGTSESHQEKTTAFRSFGEPVATTDLSRPEWPKK